MCVCVCVLACACARARDVRLLSCFATGLMICRRVKIRYISLLYKLCSILLHNTCNFSRFQEPPNLRRGSAAAHLLLLRVRIPPGEWTAVSCKCCVVSCRVVSVREVSATGRSLVKRSPTECGVSKRDREAMIMRRPWPITGCYTMK